MGINETYILCMLQIVDINREVSHNFVNAIDTFLSPELML